MKALVNVFRPNSYETIEFYQKGKTVHFNVGHSLPEEREFDSFDEAKSFTAGMRCTISYYGGICSTYMKDVDW